MNLREIANDLSAFLDGRRIEEAEEASAAVATDAEVERFEESNHPERRLARAVFDYVLTQIDEDDSQTIGQALVVGAAAAAGEAGLDETVVTDEVIALLEEIVEAAREVQ